MFLHLSVILSTGEGVSTSVHAGIHPPDTPWADTPRAETPGQTRPTPPWADTPPPLRSLQRKVAMYR